MTPVWSSPSGLWNNPGRGKDNDDEKAIDGKNKNKEMTDAQDGERIGGDEDDDEESKAKSEQSVNRGKRSVSRKWSLTLEKSLSVGVERHKKDAKTVINLY